MNNDYQFVINGVDVNDMSELKKVIRGELDKHDKELAKEFIQVAPSQVRELKHS